MSQHKFLTLKLLVCELPMFFVVTATCLVCCVTVIARMPVWLKAYQSVCTSWESVGVHCDEKGVHCDYPCCHHLPDLLVRDDPREERIKSYLWILVWCLLYFVTYGLHRKNRSTNHKVVAERGCCKRRRENLVGNRIPREWVLLENFHNTNDD